MYNLAEKYPKIGKGPNPFIDPQGYQNELDIQETAFNAILTERSYWRSGQPRRSALRARTTSAVGSARPVPDQVGDRL